MKKDSVLVINCGSSSLKFSLMNPISNQVFIQGLAERLSSNSATITFKSKDENSKAEAKETIKLPPPFDHKTAVSTLVNYLDKQGLSSRISAIGHRVVHGGEKYSTPTLITPAVMDVIKELSVLAPLHNPANITGIEAATETFNALPQVAVFDTAFHQTMPEKSYLYGLPFHLYEQHSIRRYGFHGTSHYFVSKKAAQLLDKPYEQCNVISAHLGNGCSVTAIKNGKSFDSSMGFTPLEGVMMGTRSGNIDPGIIFHLHDTLGYSMEKINTILNKESGLLGISELSNDCRTLEEAAINEEHSKAKIALELFCYRIAKSIASFSASFTELDGIIFTGGIGENSNFVRTNVVKHLSLLNIIIDEDKNQDIRFGKVGTINTQTSRYCWVIPTNEEWVIAHQTAQTIKGEE